MSRIRTTVQRLYRPLSQRIARHRIDDPHVSIISDDCWGGEYYRELGIPYLTPTIGLWINAPGYIDFICNLRDNLHAEICFTDSAYHFPFCRLNGVEIGFMHYKSQEETNAKWRRRCERVNPDRLFFKIDFGRPGFTMDDIERWNEIALPNSIALVNEKFRGCRVHNGIHLPDWKLDGAKQYAISKKYFSLISWINHGEVRVNRLCPDLSLSEVR